MKTGRLVRVRQAMLACLATATLMLASATTAQAQLTKVELGNVTLYNGLTAGNGTSNTTTDGIMEKYYGKYGVDFVRVDDSGDQLWTYLSGANGSALIDVQAKYASDNSVFGAYGSPNYNANSTDFKAVAKVNGDGYNATLTAIGTGDGGVGYQSGNNVIMYASDVQSLFAWGIHDVSTSQYFSSIASKNTSETNPNFLDHMVTFYIKTGDSAGHYVIAFEDRTASNSTDRDFNDLVLEISGVRAVPEPSTLLMAGTALVGTGLVALRRRRKSALSA